MFLRLLLISYFSCSFFLLNCSTSNEQFENNNSQPNAIIPAITKLEQFKLDLKKRVATLNWTVGIPYILGNVLENAYSNIMNSVDKNNEKKYQDFLSPYINNNCLLGQTIFQTYDDSKVKNDEDFIDMREQYQRFFASVIIPDFIKKSSLPIYNCLQRLGNLFFENNNNKIQSAEDLYIKSCALLFPTKSFENMNEPLDIHYVLAQLNKGIVLEPNILIDFLEKVEDNVWDYKNKINSFLWMYHVEPSIKNMYLLLRYFLLEDTIFRKVIQEVMIKKIDFLSSCLNIINLIKKDKSVEDYEPLMKEINENKSSLFVNYLINKNLLSQATIDLYNKRLKKNEDENKPYYYTIDEEFLDDDPMNEKFKHEKRDNEQKILEEIKQKELKKKEGQRKKLQLLYDKNSFFDLCTGDEKIYELLWQRKIDNNTGIDQFNYESEMVKLLNLQNTENSNNENKETKKIGNIHVGLMFLLVAVIVCSIKPRTTG